MCDHEFYEENDPEIVPGTSWTDSGSARLHWTDAPIFVLAAVKELSAAVNRWAGFGQDLLKSHANHVGRRRESIAAAVLDIERITGDPR